MVSWLGGYIYDVAGQNIGASESPLPYLSPALNGPRLLVGANFASAGVGILNDTGVQFVSARYKKYWFLVTTSIFHIFVKKKYYHVSLIFYSNNNKNNNNNISEIFTDSF